MPGVAAGRVPRWWTCPRCAAWTCWCTWCGRSSRRPSPTPRDRSIRCATRACSISSSSSPTSQTWSGASSVWRRTSRSRSRPEDVAERELFLQPQGGTGRPRSRCASSGSPTTSGGDCGGTRFCPRSRSSSWRTWTRTASATPAPISDSSGLAEFARGPGWRCARSPPHRSGDGGARRRRTPDAFREDLGLSEPGLERVIRTSYELLGLARSSPWAKTSAAPGPSAGAREPRSRRGTIHSDIERGFIRAEVVPFKELVTAGSLPACREQGTLRLEGQGVRGEGRGRHQFPIRGVKGTCRRAGLPLLSSPGGRRAGPVASTAASLSPRRSSLSWARTAPTTTGDPGRRPSTRPPTRRRECWSCWTSTPRGRQTLGKASGCLSTRPSSSARRGGFHLHRILARRARPQPRRGGCARTGLPVEMVAEPEARVRPLRALGGEWGWGSSRCAPKRGR